MSNFSQLTRGMPPERVRAVVPGAVSRFFYGLGLRPVRWKMLRALATARLFWRLDWWRSGQTTDVEFWMEELAQIDVDWSFRPGARQTTVAAAYPGRYIAVGVDHLSRTMAHLRPKTARATVLDWQRGPLAVCLIDDAGERLPPASPPRLIQQLTIAAIHLLLDRRGPMAESEAAFAEKDEGGLVCSVEGREVSIKRPV